MRRLLLAVPSVLPLLLAAPLAQAAPDSAYTKLHAEDTCKVTAEPAEDEGGDWSELLCTGYGDYPVYLSYADARESMFYGFPPGDKPTSWESFNGFNGVSGTIEWRLDKGVPFATILRWSIATDVPEKNIEVLVVSKVAQPDDHDGCVVGYVVAPDNPGHNVQAREIADDHARGFACWRDEPVVRAGSVPLPTPARYKRE